MPVDFPGLHLI